LTVYELRKKYEKSCARAASGGHFFDRETMRFFGDTMQNFRVRDGGKVKAYTENGVEEVEVWALYRRRPVNGGLHGLCSYFTKEEGRRLHGVAG
jgi:hypothetical protein